MEPEPVAPQDAAEPLLDLEVSKQAETMHWMVEIFWQGLHRTYVRHTFMCRPTQAAILGMPE